MTDETQKSDTTKTDATKKTVTGYRVTVDIIFPVAPERGAAARAEKSAFAFADALEEKPPESGMLVGGVKVDWGSARV